MTTIREAYGPAMAITDQAEADAYFEQLVQSRITDGGFPHEEAEQIERANLGYFAGYYSAETRERVERLFRCAHPVFGAIAERGAPTAEEAFKAGYELGSRSKTEAPRGWAVAETSTEDTDAEKRRASKAAFERLCSGAGMIGKSID